MARAWLDFLFPPSCSACGRPDPERLCERCYAGLPWLEAEESRQRGPGPLAGIRAPVSFAHPVRQWILEFKYPRRGLFGPSPAATGLVLLLARIAAQQAGDSPPSCVVPIPGHRRRFQQRGFEPSYRIALEMAWEQKVEVLPRILTRTRNTPAQTGLNAKERIINMQNAFVCHGADLPDQACIWLVDDVVTTGATLRSAARALKKAGARKVVGVCLARTITQGERRNEILSQSEGWSGF